MKEGLQNTKCPSCGYERTENDDRFHSKEECPKCGIFYKKYVESVKSKSSDETSESTKTITLPLKRRSSFTIRPSNAFLKALIKLLLKGKKMKILFEFIKTNWKFLIVIILLTMATSEIIQMEKAISSIKDDISSIKSRIRSIEYDVSSIESDVSSIQGSVYNIEIDVSSR